MKISVTQKHIDAGVRGSCSQDPVALALREAGFHTPWVSSSGIRSYDSTRKKVQDFELPDDVLQFMRDFDNLVPVEPFEFELEG